MNLSESSPLTDGPAGNIIHPKRQVYNMHEPLEDKIQTLARWIRESNNIVFFGGAGVSTESGIKDFRSPDGLFNEKMGPIGNATTVTFR
jgi:hypothetical protein